MKKAKALFRACNSKGVIHDHLCFGRDLRAGRGVEKLYSGKHRFQAHRDDRLLARGGCRPSVDCGLRSTAASMVFGKYRPQACTPNLPNQSPQSFLHALKVQGHCHRPTALSGC